MERGYGLNGWCSITGNGKIIIFSKVSRPVLGFAQPHVIIPGLKRQGH
jgi:hypothetical protein